MEEQNKPIVVSLPCPHCKNSFKVAAPDKAGVFVYQCPHCQKKVTMQWDPEAWKKKKLSLQQAAQEQRQAGQQPQVVEPDVTCPVCEAKMRFKPDHEGLHVIVCPKCQTKLEVEVKEGKVVKVEKQKTIKISNVGQPSRGCLELVRMMGLMKKRFPLKIGTNIIGRKDPDEPSDIEIEGDNAISRRSVSIEVSQSELGYQFKLKVLKATNPVKHQNNELAEGSITYLNYGDTIQLGRTKLTFKKDKS